MELTDKEKEILRYIVQERGGTVEAMKYISDLTDDKVMIEINGWKERAAKKVILLQAEVDKLTDLITTTPFEENGVNE